MKISIYNGCRDFVLSVDNKIVKNSEVEFKKIIIRNLINTIDDSDELSFIIKELAGFIEVDNFEENNCRKCGDYCEWYEFRI